uniref:Uncharacterized protein n=1 Tax=Anopheles coluzzii TaxID=1518534 RepID=A0A8W7Q2D6_ANOCL
MSLRKKRVIGLVTFSFSTVSRFSLAIFFSDRLILRGSSPRFIAGGVVSLDDAFPQRPQLLGKWRDALAGGPDRPLKAVDKPGQLGHATRPTTDAESSLPPGTAPSSSAASWDSAPDSEGSCDFRFSSVWVRSLTSALTAASSARCCLYTLLLARSVLTNCFSSSPRRMTSPTVSWSWRCRSCSCRSTSRSSLVVWSSCSAAASLLRATIAACCRKGPSVSLCVLWSAIRPSTMRWMSRVSSSMRCCSSCRSARVMFGSSITSCSVWTSDWRCCSSCGSFCCTINSSTCVSSTSPSIRLRGVAPCTDSFALCSSFCSRSCTRLARLRSCRCSSICCSSSFWRSFSMRSALAASSSSSCWGTLSSRPWVRSIRFFTFSISVSIALMSFRSSRVCVPSCTDCSYARCASLKPFIVSWYCAHRVPSSGIASASGGRSSGIRNLATEAEAETSL